MQIPILQSSWHQMGTLDKTPSTTPKGCQFRCSAHQDFLNVLMSSLKSSVERASGKTVFLGHCGHGHIVR